MKEKNLQTLILSEHLSSILYLDRIFFVLSKIYHKKKEALILTSQFYQEIISFFNHKILIHHPKSWQSENLDELYLEIRKYMKLFKTILNISFEGTVLKTIFLPFINLVYKNAHQLHLFCADYSPFQIELPRVNILKSKDIASIPYFFLDPIDFLSTSTCPILSLEDQRHKKYEEFLTKGYEAISFKQHYKAVELITRALNYRETAEVLSLLGWLYLTLNKNDNAKIFCQRAIKLDPDFGPPYNDLGLVLMDEGNLKDSLDLFNMAKKAPNYQNREYPYINSGRVYMVLKKYQLALNELRMALTLVPYHQTLHRTVEKLMNSIPSEKLCPSQEIN